MAIDRIGKGGALPLAPEVRAPEGAEEARAPFKVDRGASATGAERTGNVDAEAATPLTRLRAGEIDVHRYVDLKVEEATKSLEGFPSAQLDEIKSVLRDQLRSDPTLADLVRTATGKMPSPPED